MRCTYQDNLVNVFGIDPETGFARNPFDNVGVQYGLKALNEGKITFAQFVDINTRVGGHDIDGKIVPQRMVGDPAALRRAYETGRVNVGTGARLGPDRRCPLLHRRRSARPPCDALNVDVHDGYHSLVVRARLLKYNGTAANHVMLTAATSGAPQT